MTALPPSPKRRHILSSINPDRKRSVSPEVERHRDESSTPRTDEVPPRHATAEPGEEGDAAEDRTTKFRFKSSSSRSHRSSRHHDPEGRDRDDEERRSSRRDGHHRRRHHRHKRRRSRSPTPENPHEPPPLDPEAAFRESLFDAMADDEGASYWEGVYGQPIHIYPRSASGAPPGELEQMDDDEYAAYVRQKMWEKTHAGIVEERARREEQRKEKDRKEDDARRLTKEMEESLRRGEERRKRKAWKENWGRYVDAWQAWDGTSRDGIGWPVDSGRMEDVNGESVRDFFVRGLDPREIGETEFVARLKDERIRWHPDKMQQKLGGKVDDGAMKAITAIFQVIDKLWSDTRSKRS